MKVKTPRRDFFFILHFFVLFHRALVPLSTNDDDHVFHNFLYRNLLVFSPFFFLFYFYFLLPTLFYLLLFLLLPNFPTSQFFFSSLRLSQTTIPYTITTEKTEEPPSHNHMQCSFLKKRCVSFEIG